MPYTYIFKRFFRKSVMFYKTESSQAHKTTLLINKADWDFLQEYHYKPTALLRVKIQELRKIKCGESVDHEKINEKLKIKIRNLCDSMAKVLTEKQFKEIMNL